jgi:hypothetical protein
MFIKTHVIVICAGIVLLLMAAEWRYVGNRKAEQARIHTAREFHGLCNRGIGQPYTDFVHQVRGIYESGDTNRLGSVLRGADEHSQDIYIVWLDGKDDAYCSSIQEILTK